MVVRTHAHIVGLIDEARLPERVARGRWPPSPRWPRWRRGCTGDRSTRSTSTRSVATTPSSTSSAPAAALEVLGIDEIRASPVATGPGDGPHRPRHAAESRARRWWSCCEGVPTWGRNLPVELTTPTGAALLAALSSGLARCQRCGSPVRGSGPAPASSTSCPTAPRWSPGVRVDDRPPTSGAGRRWRTPDSPSRLLEANVDDATGEQLAHAVEALLEAGAHDAWLSPVIMKKGRPGSVVHVLADPSWWPASGRSSGRPRDRSASGSPPPNGGRRPARSTRSGSTAN